MRSEDQSFFNLGTAEATNAIQLDSHSAEPEICCRCRRPSPRPLPQGDARIVAFQRLLAQAPPGTLVHMRGWVCMHGCRRVLAAHGPFCCASRRPLNFSLYPPPTHHVPGPHDAITSRLIPLALGAAGAYFAAQGFYHVVFGIGAGGVALRAKAGGGVGVGGGSSGATNKPSAAHSTALSSGHRVRHQSCTPPPSCLSACTLQASWTDEES